MVILKQAVMAVQDVHEQEDISDKVKEILSGSSKFKAITVSKEVEPVIDPGTLLLTDLQPVDIKEFK